MKVGYARVSSSGQSLEVQLEALKNIGCEKIFQEKVSGTSTQGRTQLKECLEFVREGDEFCFSRVDRVARSVLDLQLIVKELTEKGVLLTATEQPISTKDATSKCFETATCLLNVNSFDDISIGYGAPLPSLIVNLLLSSIILITFDVPDSVKVKRGLFPVDFIILGPSIVPENVVTPAIETLSKFV